MCHPKQALNLAYKITAPEKAMNTQTRAAHVSLRAYVPVKAMMPEFVITAKVVISSRIVCLNPCCRYKYYRNKHIHSSVSVPSADILRRAWFRATAYLTQLPRIHTNFYHQNITQDTSIIKITIVS